MQSKPRLSPTIARDLLDCPLKAWTRHRLLGGLDIEKTAAMLEGQLMERLITGHDVARIAIIEATDYRTKAAQEARDAAIEAGRVPIIAAKYEAAKAVADIISAKVNDALNGWKDAIDQVRLEWEADGCECSGVLDRLYIGANGYRVFDLKKTESARPHDLEMKINRYGYHLQHAAYLEAVNTLHPHLAGRGEFFFVFYETEPPYCVTPATLDGAFREGGEIQWRHAKRIWRDCVSQNNWREYVIPGEVATLEARPWQMADMGVMT